MIARFSAVMFAVVLPVMAAPQRLAAAAPEGVGLPTLDEMAGEWLPLSVVGNPPAVHNFNQMLIVNRDLTSFFCHPGGLFSRGADPMIQWRVGYPLVRLSVDGVEPPAREVRWYAYRVLRRNLECAGLAVQTDTRMVNEQRGVLCRITVSNASGQAKTAQIALRVPGQLDNDGPGVINSTQTSRTTSAIQPSRKPDAVTVAGTEVVWHWTLALPAGASASIGYVAGDEINSKKDEARTKVAAWAHGFDAEMTAFEAVWKKRWADAFTPGNDHFSGNLPILNTDDAALRRNYYMGALTMLVLERTLYPIPRGFITSGERAEGIQYFWDASMQSTAWALLEPESMKATLRRWLVQNPRNSYHISLRDTGGFDAAHQAVMKGYAANACTIVQTTDTYLRTTGDRGFLDEKLENSKTVLQNLDALATDWETLPKGPHGLVNYGGPGQLLETPFLYVQCVAAVNAQNVWMMRQIADWHAWKGDDGRARELRREAEAFLPAVLTLYNQDSGAWNLIRVDGTIVPVQHCFDYIYVANALANDLSAEQKRGMNEFVQRELFTRDWMRAMSLKDPDVPKATRPDHAYTGAYDGWIPLTAGAMWRLGEPRAAYEFFCRTAVVTREGPFAQAHEFYGSNPTSSDAPVRIAMRGANMKECISGAAFADVPINIFFGYHPSIDGKTLLTDEKTPRPFSGTLQNVRHGRDLYTIFADKNGLKVQAQ